MPTRLVAVKGELGAGLRSYEILGGGTAPPSLVGLSTLMGSELAPNGIPKLEPFSGGGVAPFGPIRSSAKRVSGSGGRGLPLAQAKHATAEPFGGWKVREGQRIEYSAGRLGFRPYLATRWGEGGEGGVSLRTKHPAAPIKAAG